MAVQIAPGVVTTASGTKHVPSAKSRARRSAAAMARRVLPMPPGPLSVSKRHSGPERISAMRPTSISRPTNGVAGRGRLRRMAEGCVPPLAGGCGIVAGLPEPPAQSPATRTAGAVIVLSRSNPNSMRATLRKMVRSAPGICSVSASSSATWREGRRSSASILRMAEIEQPTRSANSSCVRSNARRRWRIQLPKEKVSAMVVTV